MDQKAALAMGLAEQVHALKFKLVQRERELEELKQENRWQKDEIERLKTALAEISARK